MDPHFLGNEGLEQSRMYKLADYSTQSIEAMNHEIKLLIAKSNKSRTGADYVQQFLYIFLKKQDYYFNGLPDYTFKFPITDGDIQYA